MNQKYVRNHFARTTDETLTCLSNEETIRSDVFAAIQAYADEHYQWGRCYHHGRGVKKNVEVAVGYYHRAAEQGHADAQYHLGVCYKNGEGVEKNIAEAIRYYWLAAKQGHASAQNRLGWCYQQGVGVEKNLAQAIQYYRLAAAQGHTGAQSILSKLSKAHCVAQKRSYASVQHYVGGSYQTGEMMEEALERTKTLRYHRLSRGAVQSGDAQAQYDLGGCYQYGEGVEKDLEKAVWYYRLAAAQGHVGAYHTLSQLVETYPDYPQATNASSYSPMFFASFRGAQQAEDLPHFTGTPEEVQATPVSPIPMKSQSPQ